jgi:2-haloacid dehalogenase
LIDGPLQRQLGRTTLLTFDCYGTLIDWSAGLGAAFREIFGPEIEKRHTELFGAYVSIEADVEAEAYRPYRKVLELTLRRLAIRLGLSLPEGREGALTRLLPKWRPFADTNAALGRLRRRFRLGVLSNIDRELFAATARQLSVPFDFLISAEDVRAYKPAAAHFERLKEQEGSLDHVLHIAQSAYHDGVPAEKLGLAFVWINRYKEHNRTSARPLGEFADLVSFADIACS